MTLRKGMEFIHKDTKERIIYGKKCEDGRLWCITSTRTFIKVSKEELDTQYVSVTDINKKAKERRSREGW